MKASIKNSTIPNDDRLKKDNQKSLVKELIKGEKSKRIENFDYKNHLKALHKKYLFANEI